MDLHCFFYHIRNSGFSLLLIKNKHNIDCIFACMVAFFVNEIFFENFNIVLLQNYFNDLLAMPAMLSYINLVLSFFGKESVYKTKSIFWITCCCGFIWEIVAIWVKPSSTCDVLDFLCYMIGAIGYKLLNGEK